MKNAGFTLLELVITAAILSVMVLAFSSMLKYSTQATIKSKKQSESQEGVRQALGKIEHALAHANQITIASADMVEFICDINQRRDYGPNADTDGDGVPNYRDADTDNDAMLLLPAADQWQAGYNLKDDDEDSDGKIDVKKRIYLAGSDIMMDTSLNEEPWSGRKRRLMANAATFTMTYFGNKANLLGKSIDLGADGIAGTGDPGENDGIITAGEMDSVQPPQGMGNSNGLLDTTNEMRYITSVRINIAAGRNSDGTTDYAIETDIYPTILPLKSR